MFGSKAALYEQNSIPKAVYTALGMLFNTLTDKGVSVSETLHADKQAIGDEMISGTHSGDGVGLLRLFDLIYSDESVYTAHEQEEVSRSYLTDVLEALVLRRFFFG